MEGAPLREATKERSRASPAGAELNGAYTLLVRGTLFWGVRLRESAPTRSKVLA